MTVGLALYGLFALTFSYFQIKGDALVYFNLLRRFFGEEPDFAFAYQFGTALWNAPFFLVGKAFGTVFGFQPRLFHVSFEEISITLATNAAFVVTLYLGWRILRELDLPRGPAVLFLTTFGSPLFFYVVLDPAEKHAVDTLALTAAAFALLRMASSHDLKAAMVLGMLAGWAVNIRVANAAFFFVLLIGLLLQRRFRQAGAGTAVAVAVAPLILILPALRDIPYHIPERVPFGPASVTERTGWAPFNGGTILLVEAPAFSNADTIETIATLNSDGAYADVYGLTPGATYAVSVFVRGSSGETVRGSSGETVRGMAESPPGTFQAYLGGGRTPLHATWQRLNGAVTVGETGVLRVAIASQSGSQTFYIAARQVELQAASAASAASAAPPDTSEMAAVRMSSHLVAADLRPSRSAETVQAPSAEGLFADFDPSIPLKMLVSEHRGLFLWTPLTAFAVLGFILLLARTWGSRVFGSFLAPLSLGALALLSTHVIWPHWDGGFAFSQRFLTGLFPLYLIGVAELIRRARVVVYPLLVLSVLFAVAIAFVHDVGYDAISERDGIARHVDAGWENRRNMRLDVQDDAKARYAYLWGLLHGRDSACFNERLGTPC